MHSLIKKIKLFKKRYSHQINQYIALMLIPLLLVVFLYSGVNVISVRQLKEQGESTAKHFQAKSSAMLGEIEHICNSLCDDFNTYIRNNSKNGNTSDYRFILKNRISGISSLSSVYLLCKGNDVVYSPNCTYSYSCAESLIKSISPALKLNAVSYSQGWHMSDTRFEQPYYIRNVFDSSGEVFATLIAAMNVSTFYHMIHDVDADVVALFNDSFAVSSILRTLSDVDWKSDSSVSNAIGKDVECFYIEDTLAGGESFTYMVGITTESFRKPLKLILSTFVCYSAAVVFFGSIYTVAIAKRRYLMLREIIDIVPEKVEDNQSYMDMLNSIKNTITTVNNNDSSRDPNLLTCILRGYYSTELDSGILKDAGIVLSRSYRVAIFSFPSYEAHPTQAVVNGLADAHCVVLEAALNKTCNKYKACVVRMDLTLVAVLGIEDLELSSEELNRDMADIMTFFEQQYGMQMYIAVSSAVSSASSLPEAFFESNQLSAFLRAIDSDIHILFQDFLQTKGDFAYSGKFIKDLQVLTSTLTLKKYDLVPAMVESLLKEHVRDSDIPYTFARGRVVCVANVLAEYIIDSDMDAETSAVKSASLRSATSISKVVSITSEAMNALISQNGEAPNAIIVKACDYIRENLSDHNLGVTQICDSINVSMQYLSRLFKKQFHMTVVEYLNSTRVNQAKQLLESTTQTITSIADSVGYNNSVTFVRNFKLFIGMTPSEYRELRKHSNS